VNAQRLNRGVAALVNGQVAFDPAVRFAGVVLNRVRGARHEGKLRDAVERYCRVEVLGVLPDLPELAIAERHLGLTPLEEVPDLAPIVERIGAAVARHVDLERVEAIAGAAGALPASPEPGRGAAHAGGSRERVRIGVALDRAFTFYYPENLEALVAAGAELVPFSPLDDPRLPPVAGLYFGGGFPELFMERLAANAPMREQVRRAIAAGVPAWAECGGLMYLSRGISWRGRRAAMAGALPCAVEMDDRPAGHGYVLLEETGEGPWPSAGRRLRGHEFHHSRLVDLEPGRAFAYRALRGAGAVPGFDGMLEGACVAGYTHLHADGAPSWAADFAGLARERGVTT
jgi:cobyrinic acid a,c-diamide synthase